MLKLSGWPRLTWGLGPRMPPGIHASGVTRGSRSGHEGRRTARVSNPPLATAGPNWQATCFSPPSPRTRKAMLRIPPHKIWGRSVHGQLTPRQACPQPDGLGRNLRSKTRWFTGFCNSHHVSHFATFFIDARAEISVAESHSIILFRQRDTARPAPEACSFPVYLGDNFAPVLNRGALLAYRQGGRRHGPRR